MQHPKATAFFENALYFKEELKILRNIVLSTGLTEGFKWEAPVYMHNLKNIVGIASFKKYAGLWFFQGALLTDPHKILINANKGKTIAMRQLRFESEIQIEENIIKEYVLEAIANQEKGKVIKFKKSKPLQIPLLLGNALTNDTVLNECFEALKLTQKREYAEHIDSAKRALTKKKRLDKIIPLIKNGVGLNDQYR